jgi:hypothetical protein
MKKNNTAILVHPFWCINVSDYDNEFYYNNIEEYEKVIVFLPELDSEFKRSVLKYTVDDLINYLLYNGPITEAMSRMLREPILEVMKKTHKLSNVNKILNPIKIKIGGKTTYKYHKLTPKDLLKKFFASEVKNNDVDFTIMFDSDNTYNDEYMEARNKFINRYKNNDKVIIVKAGNMISVSNVLRKIFRKPEAKDISIDIFGEFLNQCVFQACQILDVMKVDYHVREELSAFNSAGGETNDKCFISTDKYIYDS